MKRFFCLINSASGAGQGRALLDTLSELCRQGVFGGEIAALDPPHFKSQIERATQFDALLVGGGDGTFSRVAAELVGSETPLGLLPLGVGNDLAKELGVYRLFSPAHPQAMLQTYTAAQVRELSVWRATFASGFSVRFVDYISFGFDARAAAAFGRLRSRHPWLPRLVSRLGSYALYGACGCINASYRIPSGCRVFEDSGATLLDASGSKTLIFSNIRSYAGLGAATRSSSPSDTILECSLLESLIGYLKIFMRRNVERCAASGFRIECGAADIPFQADGEPYEEKSGAWCKISREGSVRVLVP